MHSSSRIALLVLLATPALWAGCGDCYSNEHPGTCQLLSGDDSGDSGDTAVVVDTGDPPAAAKAVLSTYCYPCHGQNGSVSGGMNFILDVGALTSKTSGNGQLFVDPGHSADSYVITRMSQGTMPPVGSPAPSAAEIQAVTDWIDLGAADFNEPVARAPIELTEAFRLAYTDLQSLPSMQRPFIRYISLVHLYNANIPDDQLDTYRAGLSKLLNSLSWQAQITNPVAIDPDSRALYRIDIRDYKWEAGVSNAAEAWEYLIAQDPYAFNYSGGKYSDFQNLRDATGSRMPILHGDWLVEVASRPPLYYRILGIPDTEAGFLAKFGVTDKEGDVNDVSVVRAGFNTSGVSVNNRLIERHNSSYGYCWTSYDFADEAGSRNLYPHPLNFGLTDDPFTEDGGEDICSLPNRLQAYALYKASGDILDVGPTKVVKDPNRPDDDSKVVNGLSCMNCHFDGMILKEDGVRTYVEDHQSDFTNDELEAIRIIYPGNGDTAGYIGWWLQRDQQQFLDAEAQTRIERVVEDQPSSEPAETTSEYTVSGEPVFQLALDFEGELDVYRAAAEVGHPISDTHTVREFIDSLPAEAENDLSSLETGTVSRTLFELHVRNIICRLDGQHYTDAIPGVCGDLPEARGCGEDITDSDGLERHAGLACLSDQVCIDDVYTGREVQFSGSTPVQTEHTTTLAVCAPCQAAETCGDGIDNDCNNAVDDTCP